MKKILTIALLLTVVALPCQAQRLGYKPSDWKNGSGMGRNGGNVVDDMARKNNWQDDMANKNRAYDYNDSNRSARDVQSAPAGRSNGFYRSSGRR